MTNDKSRNFWISSLICFCLFASLLILFRDYVLDDAFITYRFSQNFASGHGLVWNKNGPPTEGYTSFLWMALNALALKMGIDAVLFSRAIDIVCVSVISLVLIKKTSKYPLPFCIAIGGALTLNPSVAFLAMEGMGTWLGSGLCFLLSIWSIKGMRYMTGVDAFACCFLGFLCVLSRPDAFAFAAPLLTSMALLLYSHGRKHEVLVLIAWGIAFVLLGTSYLLWRHAYFSDWLPTAAYLKFGIGRHYGSLYLISFIAKVALPYLLMWLILFKGRPLLKPPPHLVPAILGCSAFCAFVLVINPIQGSFWRFLYPIFPVALILMIEGLRACDQRIFCSKPIAIVSLSLVLVWNTFLLPQIFAHKRLTHQGTRVAIGRQLNGLNGVLFTTASGAIPYFSEWDSADTMGLTSQEVARGGVSSDFLCRLNPDVMILVGNHAKGKSYDSGADKLKVTSQYMMETGFVAIAAIERTKDVYLFCFCRRNSPIFAAATDRLLNIQGVHYGEPEELILGRSIPIWKIPVD